jgi:hypothetical protein
VTDEAAVEIAACVGEVTAATIAEVGAGVDSKLSTEARAAADVSIMSSLPNQSLFVA